MIIRHFAILSIIMQMGLAATITKRDGSEPTLSECAAKGGECDETRGRPVCGTDDRTYPSRCHLMRAQCSGYEVSLKYRGPCRAACKEARGYALKNRFRSATKFVPRCRHDGTYASVQCLGETGCWCSDKNGKPIENTTVRNGKPKCRQYNNKGNTRRSTGRNVRPATNRRVCNVADRSLFKNNLISIFQSEYMRTMQANLLVAAVDNIILDWKFAQLDMNFNKMLDKNEFRELKKLVKGGVKPRRCGRVFGKLCDVDGDERLSQTEWNNCITKDGTGRHTAIEHKFNANNKINSNNNNNNNNHNSVLSSHHSNAIHVSSNNNNNNNNNQRHQFTDLDPLERESAAAAAAEYDGAIGNNGSQGMLENEYDDEEDVDLDMDDDLSFDMHHFRFDSILNPYDSLSQDVRINLRPKADSPLKESEGEFDCLADQAAALDLQRHDNGNGSNIYVPDCTPDGRYQRVQCYRSTPYCWCVHEDSGKPIPDSSVKNRRPQCDNIQPTTRPMKGCPEPKKSVFLRDLKEYLKTKFIPAATAANMGSNVSIWVSEDERIATLSFVLLDKNKNKAWERKEWKTFREMVTSSKMLRKCGKKMPRYCDVNSDKKITLSEWLNCLQAQTSEIATGAGATTADSTTTSSNNNNQSNETTATKTSKLVGSNPLHQYLKD